MNKFWEVWWFTMRNAWEDRDIIQMIENVVLTPYHYWKFQHLSDLEYERFMWVYHEKREEGAYQ